MFTLFNFNIFFFLSIGGDISDLITVIEKGKVDFPQDVEVSIEAKELIKSMLQYDEQKRISFSDFFKHPWLKQVSSLEKEKSGIELYDQSIKDVQTALKNALKQFPGQPQTTATEVFKK